MPRVDIKICGTTSVEDGRAALDAGADYLGFVFASKSPRFVKPADAARIIAALGSGCRAVGVFVNESRETVERTARECGLAAVQLHADEQPADFVDFPVAVWRAVAFRDGAWKPAPGSWAPERYVVDAAVPGMYGGTGVAADWDRAADLAAGRRVMLAGGLTAAIVAKAIRRVKPLGVDAVSGVEASPGRKDRRKLEAFIKAARES